MVSKIRNHKDLRVYRAAVDSAMAIFHLTEGFPYQEKFSMVDQIRRASRSVCANIAEAWRKRRYRAAFIAKLNDAESEACETQVWIELARRCGYIDPVTEDRLDDNYEHIVSQIFLMIKEVDKWVL